jgi:hypothetical protein
MMLMTKRLGLNFASLRRQVGGAMLSMERVFRKALPMTALVALCLAMAACGGEDEVTIESLNTGTEVALVPSVPGLPTIGAQTLDCDTGRQRTLLQREAAQDISPDPIPARDASGTGVVNSGAGSESTGGGTSSETTGTTKR